MPLSFASSWGGGGVQLHSAAVCGIVGQVRADQTEVRAELIARMCGALEHRGPDSRGMHLANGVGLGMQRLAIIDLSSGEQPIFNEDGSVAVVLNGEIYNFRELRRELENSSAKHSRCSVASTTSASERHQALVEPPGRQVSGASDPAKPFAASFTVPSPPKATTTS